MMCFNSKIKVHCLNWFRSFRYSAFLCVLLGGCEIYLPDVVEWVLELGAGFGSPKQGQQVVDIGIWYLVCCQQVDMRVA